MLRFRALLPYIPGLALLLLLATPVAVHAASLPLFSAGWSIVPEACRSCACGFAGVLAIVQNFMNAAVSLAVVVAVLIIAYAGFMFIMTPMNPEAHSSAKKMLTNAIVGFVIVLAAWLMVDFVMKALYSGTSGEQGKFGPWNSILTGGDVCIMPQTPQQVTGLPGAINTVISGGTLATVGGVAGPASTGTGNCAPSTIQQGASAGGYTLTTAQTNTLSCIAIPESSCGTKMSGATTQNGTVTSAAGMFQIILGTNDTCHSLNIPICTQAALAAGFKVSGNLNCSTAFSGGVPKAGMEQLAHACQAAANNTACNASAAACILKSSPNFSAWTTDPRSAAQQACVAKYAGG